MNAKCFKFPILKLCFTVIMGKGSHCTDQLTLVRFPPMKGGPPFLNDPGPLFPFIEMPFLFPLGIMSSVCSVGWLERFSLSCSSCLR